MVLSMNESLSVNFVLKYLTVSSAFPEKKTSYPRNLWSSFAIEEISLSPMCKGIWHGLPDLKENALHFEGFNIIPMD